MNHVFQDVQRSFLAATCTKWGPPWEASSPSAKGPKGFLGLGPKGELPNGGHGEDGFSWLKTAI